MDIACPRRIFLISVDRTEKKEVNDRQLTEAQATTAVDAIYCLCYHGVFTVKTLS